MRIHAARVFIDSAFVDATITVHDGYVQAVAEGRTGACDTEFDSGSVVPGFIDAHCHGGGGGAFTDGGDVDRVLAAHRAHGVTRMMASLVTDDEVTLLRQIEALAPRVDTGELLGIHLEGPWLAPSRRGAHAEELLTAPALAMVQRLVQHRPEAVRMVTIAPELPGALDAIAWLDAHGVVASIGHTAADFDAARAAIAAGATGATHLFNAMPPLDHRNPGPVLALLDDDRVTLELVLDGVHVHPALAAHVMRIAGHRACLVSDAMAAAASVDGEYELGRLAVQVRDGVARVAGTDTIAGSTLTLDRAVRVAVQHGVPLEQAVAAATIAPARYLGLHDLGRIAVGMRADFVHLDDALQVRAVMRDGRWIAP